MGNITAKVLFFSALIAFVCVGTAQSALSDFETGIYWSSENYDLYWAFYDPYKSSTAPAGETYPLLIYLHGSGNAGRDISGPATHPNSTVLLTNAKNAETRAYVLIPQTHTSWQATSSAYRALRELIADFAAQYPIDTDRVYMTGFSLGGIGVFSVSGYYPDDVAAIVPMAGNASYFGGENTTAMANRATVSTWAFSGNLDGTVTPESARISLENQAAYGCRPCFTVYASAGHNQVWDEVRNKDQDAMISWMYSQENGQPQDDSMFVGWPINEDESVQMPSGTHDFSLDYFVGYYGRGELVMDSMSEINCRKGYIAAQAGSRGNVEVGGRLAAWNCTGNMYVGVNNGVGSLHVNEFSSVSCDTMVLNQFSFLSGEGTITCTELRNEAEINPGGVMTHVEPSTNPLTFGGEYIYAPVAASSIDLVEEPLIVGQAGDSIGTLTIDGQCRFYSKSSLNIEIGAGECDSLSVSDTLYLTGGLNVSYAEGFAASDGDEFVIATASAVSGTFSEVSGTTGPDGLYFEVVYESDQVKLQAIQRIAGDIDGDGHVTIMDFLYFKASYGRQSGATWADGDYDGDGDVDIIDFLKLKNNYGKY